MKDGRYPYSFDIWVDLLSLDTQPRHSNHQSSYIHFQKSRIGDKARLIVKLHINLIPFVPTYEGYW